MAATDKCGLSQAKLALKFGVQKSYIHKVLKKEGYKNYKRDKAPECSEGKKIAAENNSLKNRQKNDTNGI